MRDMFFITNRLTTFCTYCTYKTQIQGENIIDLCGALREREMPVERSSCDPERRWTILERKCSLETLWKGCNANSQYRFLYSFEGRGRLWKMIGLTCRIMIEEFITLNYFCKWKRQNSCSKGWMCTVNWWISSIKSRGAELVEWIGHILNW